MSKNSEWWDYWKKRMAEAEIRELEEEVAELESCGTAGRFGGFLRGGRSVGDRQQVISRFPPRQ